MKNYFYLCLKIICYPVRLIKRIVNKLRIRYCDAQSYIILLRKSGIKIGKECDIEKSVFWGSEPYLITIGDHVRITSGVRFITHDGGVWILRDNPVYSFWASNADKFGKITVGNNVHIGMDTIIMPGVTIGNNVVIGCSAVVTHDVPDNTIAAGVPARIIESVADYASKIQKNYLPTKQMNQKEKKKYLIKYYENISRQ